jgi:hypothetical protein
MASQRRITEYEEFDMVAEPLKGEEDPVLEALTSLSAIATSSAGDLTALNEDLQRVRQRRLQGSSWRHIMADGGSPHLLSTFSKVVADLGRACGQFRRALALGLRREGLQVTEIGMLFHVSRQRVSALIRSSGMGEEDETADRNVPATHSLGT